MVSLLYSLCLALVNRNALRMMNPNAGQSVSQKHSRKKKGEASKCWNTPAEPCSIPFSHCERIALLTSNHSTVLGTELGYSWAQHRAGQPFLQWDALLAGHGPTDCGRARLGWWEWRAAAIRSVLSAWPALLLGFVRIWCPQGLCLLFQMYLHNLK